MDLRSRLKKRAVRYGSGFLAAAAAFLCLGLYRLPSASREAFVYDAICRELVANTTEGRQALVSSVWWPPLQSLVRLPFALMLRPVELPLASLCASAFFAAACLLLLDRVLGNWGLKRLRFAFLATVALSPAFLGAASSGSSAAAALFFMLLSAYALVEWVTRRRLRSLVYFAFALAMLPFASLDAALWGAVALLALLGDLAVRPFRPRQREAVLLMTLAPLLYVVGLWMLMNWLIMGDGLYFVRSLLSGAAPAASSAGAPAGMGFAHGVAALLCVLVAAVSMATKRRETVYLGLLGAMPPVLAWMLNGRGWFWDSSPLLTAAQPLAALAVARLVATADAPRARWAAVGAAALGTVCLLATAGADGARPPANLAAEDVAARVARRVRVRSPFVKVYVCGYDGFLLTPAASDDTFVRALDFNFNRAVADYRGHHLFLLVHKPEGRSAMDSVHWKFDAIYELGDRATLYEDDFGPWRLYEIIQAR